MNNNELSPSAHHRPLPRNPERQLAELRAAVRRLRKMRMDAALRLMRERGPG